MYKYRYYIDTTAFQMVLIPLLEPGSLPLNKYIHCTLHQQPATHLQDLSHALQSHARVNVLSSQRGEGAIWGPAGGGIM
jgi:hypothetical protein